VIRKYFEIMSQHIEFIVAEASNLTPEIYASFPSRVVFHFYDSFNITGWKRDLQYEDLFSLTKDNRRVT
jgi:hypothetical protein